MLVHLNYKQLICLACVLRYCNRLNEYVRICAQVYKHMNACTYTYLFEEVFKYAHTRTHTHTLTYTHTHTLIYLQCIYECACACVLYVYICVSKYVRICLHLYICVWVRVYVCIWVSMCVYCVYVCACVDVRVCTCAFVPAPACVCGSVWRNLCYAGVRYFALRSTLNRSLMITMVPIPIFTVSYCPLPAHPCWIYPFPICPRPNPAKLILYTTL